MQKKKKKTKQPNQINETRMMNQNFKRNPIFFILAKF